MVVFLNDLRPLCNVNNYKDELHRILEKLKKNVRDSDLRAEIGYLSQYALNIKLSTGGGDSFGVDILPAPALNNVKRGTPIFYPFVRCHTFLQRAQCSHCKRCISYSNSVCLSVCPSVRPSVRPSVTRRYRVKTTAGSTVQFALSDSNFNFNDID